VYYLNRYFTAFDEISAKYGLEKIKTIGDAYMCASGLNGDDESHTLKLIAATREMIQFTLNQISEAETPNFKLRAGIHTGPVIAGVVGKKKFAYDIWGDTVNTAARMEQISVANEITISDETYLRIKDHIRCIAKGLIEVKGKGTMQIYAIQAFHS
jgi:class 3 adenylate cyclase